MVIEMRHRFDGDLDGLLSATRAGRVFSINGRSLPVAGARMAGSIMLVPFDHRTLEIDLSSAIERVRRSGTVDLSMVFEK